MNTNHPVAVSLYKPEDYARRAVSRFLAPVTPREMADWVTDLDIALPTVRELTPADLMPLAVNPFKEA